MGDQQGEEIVEVEVIVNNYEEIMAEDGDLQVVERRKVGDVIRGLVNQMEYLYNFVVHDTTLRPSPFEDMCILDQIEHFNQELPNPRENELKPTQKPKMDNILLNKKNSEILVSDSGSTPERSGII